MNTFDAIIPANDFQIASHLQAKIYKKKNTIKNHIII